MYIKPFRRCQQMRRLEAVQSHIQERCHLRGGKTRLWDAGCGEGYSSSVVPEVLNNTLLAEMGSSPRKLRAAGHSLRARQTVMTDAEDFPFSNVTFHVVFSLETLEHPTDPVGALMEIARVLRPGGTLFLSEPGSSSFNTAISYQLKCLRQGGTFRVHH